jgi:hypothetical protein
MPVYKGGAGECPSVVCLTMSEVRTDAVVSHLFASPQLAFGDE